MTRSTEDAPATAKASTDVRERILETASRLFYGHGVRAVGVDLVVAEAGIAKTSLYRHFPSKDDLVVAFLEREDAEFWAVWDAVSAGHRESAGDELDAQIGWIAERLTRPRYRGCPQINVAAEFAEADHPARMVARRHKAELRQRLDGLALRLGARRPEMLGAQLAVVINGAFASAEMLADRDPAEMLLELVRALVRASV
ncbi:TetR/AcrR family transcriptional regulator [Brevundimonas sp. R86498]|uniref:TetR/AcrR family transcriptional regulator n=1 Tax=Brevundimonas sp. R86498 TaxID=3093845 RepID=UPI0037CAE8C6